MADDLPAQPDGIRRIFILGTGLIGSSLGLALRRAGFDGAIFGWDRDPVTLKQARAFGAVDPAPADPSSDDPFIYAMAADLIVLAGPVFAIADWLDQLALVLSPSQLVTDVGSVKSFLVDRARPSYNGPSQPGYLPGHPMAGKEHAGCSHAEGTLFNGAAWLFAMEASPAQTNGSEPAAVHPLAGEWRAWVERIGARPLDFTPERHDLLCAWISHLPQMAATALSAVLEQSFKQTFAAELDQHSGLQTLALGGRALREMTRLGASPYSMWRDIAHVNAPAISAALLAFEQELTHIRENLNTPELREAFAQANSFRQVSPSKP